MASKNKSAPPKDIHPKTTTLPEIARGLESCEKKIILIYAFNGVGKTRLSMAYKDCTKDKNNGAHAGVYYNAYSEDIFTWDNDIDNNEQEPKLMVQQVGIVTQIHDVASFEERIWDGLSKYSVTFDFDFAYHNNDDKQGIKYIRFFPPEHLNLNADITSIKISRGEQQIFMVCFFLALFRESYSAENHNKHFFIDDPVSSFDEHNTFVTASALLGLIEASYLEKSVPKIIITTHHIGFFSTMADWLTRGEKADRYKNTTVCRLLKKEGETYTLSGGKKGDIFLYHLFLLRTLAQAVDSQELYTYHFAMLRQILENISSFLGSGQFSYVLKEVGIDTHKNDARIINTMSHERVFQYKPKALVDDNKILITNIFECIQKHFRFNLGKTS